MSLELSITLDIVPEATRIGGVTVREWEKATEQQRVKIVGPLDKRTCPRCLPHVNQIYKADDPRIRCWTHGSGMHPRCRHWAEPVAPEAEARGKPGEGPTGSDFVEKLVLKGHTKDLDAIFGPIRAKLLAGKQVSLAQLYTTAGELRTLEKIGFTRTGIRAAPLTRAERAKVSHKAMSKQKEALATKNEKRVARALRGKQTPDNAPFDVLAGRDAIEVKTIVAGKNPKITMHPESLARKKQAARKEKLQTHTVVIDNRTGKVYYRRGLGSFRLSSMQEVKNLDAVHELIQTTRRKR